MVTRSTGSRQTPTMVAAVAQAAVPLLAFFACYAAPRLKSWGATPAEQARTWPGDELLPDAGFVWMNAITVDRSAAEVWPWITQLGQGRAGLYSYDWLENAVGCDVHSVDHVIPELQGPLAVGDRVIRMARYAPYNPVARYDQGHVLVLGGVRDTDDQLREGRPSSTWAFIVEPVDAGRSRVVVRSRGHGLAARLQGPAQFVMQRRMLVGIKQRAEGTWKPSLTDVLVPLSWFTAVAIAGVHAARVRRGGPDSTRAGLRMGLCGVMAQILLFGDLSTRARLAVVAGLSGSMVEWGRRA